MTFKLFVSAATDDFAAEREELATAVAEDGLVEVIHQGNLTPRATTTLVKLARQIDAVDMVAQLIGPNPGRPVTRKHIDEFLDGRFAKTVIKDPVLLELLHEERLSFTQLEGIIALSLGKPVFFYGPPWEAQEQPPGAALPMAEYLALLEERGRYLEQPPAGGPDFASVDRLGNELVKRVIAQRGRHPWVLLDEAHLEQHAGGQQPASDEALLGYFDGGHPTWEIALDQRIPTLPLGEELFQSITAPRDKNALEAFIGPSGDGKSTLLRQVAVRVARETDIAVFWLPIGSRDIDLERDLSVRDTLDLLVAETTLLVVDQAHRATSFLHVLLKEAWDLDTKRVIVLVAARSTDWIAVNGPRFIPAGDQCTTRRYQSIGFDAASARAIVAEWEELEQRGLAGLRSLQKTTPERRADQLQRMVTRGLAEPGADPERCDPRGESLYGGILAARFDAEGLRDHLKRMMEKLHLQDPTLLWAFTAIALVDAMGLEGLDPKVLAATLEIEKIWRFKAEVIGPLGVEVPTSGAAGSLPTSWADRKLSRKRDDLLLTRHPSIARAAIAVATRSEWGLDLVDLMSDLVVQAIRVAHQGEIVVGHGDLAHASARVQRALGDLLRTTLGTAEGNALVDRMAIESACAAYEAAPRVDFRCQEVHANIEAGDPQHATSIAEGYWPTLQEDHVDHEQHIRGYTILWARAERERGAPEAALRLWLFSLADQLQDGAGVAIPISRHDLGHALRGISRVVREDPFRTIFEQPDALLAAGNELLPDTRAESVTLADVSPLAPPELARAMVTAAARTLDLVPEVMPGAELSFATFESAYARLIYSRVGPILRHLPGEPEATSLYIGLEEYWDERQARRVERELAAGRTVEPHELWPHQTKAFEHVVDEKSVVLSTPTGSGKTEVALAAHFTAFALGRRSVYTAPTKALVNEKFFNLCQHFGSRNVGLMTGDAVVNADAPIICCTVRILELICLRDGEDTPFDWVVMDEFHKFGDEKEGQSWLVPLVVMDWARFLLMSATLGDPELVREYLSQRSTAPVEVVHSTTRPVELEYDYREQLLREAVEDVRREALTPAYIVTFSRKDASREAGKLVSGSGNQGDLDPAEKARRKQRKEVIRARVRNQQFDTPFGKTLAKYLPSSIGVHHGGMLPRYRRTVEKLAQENLLDFVCGTDTLGVGVDLPIRTVILSRLYKWHGHDRGKGLLDAGELRQIAGRAGRKGYMDELGSNEKGLVWALAPEHLLTKSTAPDDYVKYNKKTLDTLREKAPPFLKPRLQVDEAMVSSVLLRPEDGEAALHDIIERSGVEDAARERALTRLDDILANLQERGAIGRLGAPDAEGRSYHVSGVSTTFNRPLWQFLVHALERLPNDSPYGLNVLSVVESILSGGAPILRVQQGRAEQELKQEYRERGEYYEWEELRDEASPPRPCGAFIDDLFEAWSVEFPALADEAPVPKSIARDMYEGGCGFNEYITACSYTIRRKNRKAETTDLRHAEGTLLHYLTDVYRVMSRDLPDPIAEHDEVVDVTEWLGELVRAIDTSVLHEWERLENPDLVPEQVVQQPRRDITLNERAFGVMTRNAAFRWVQDLARRTYEALQPADIPTSELERQLAPFFEEHEHLLTDADARSGDYYQFTGERVTQTLLDPEGTREWQLIGRVDREASAKEGTAVLVLEEVRRLGQL